MAESKELRTNFTNLENRILKLIYLHKEVKEKNLELLAENRRLLLDMSEEKGKLQRIEEGYRNLKHVEKSGTKQSITQIKKRITNIIGELDKNISLMEVNNK